MVKNLKNPFEGRVQSSLFCCQIPPLDDLATLKQDKKTIQSHLYQTPLTPLKGLTGEIKSQHQSTLYKVRLLTKLLLPWWLRR